MEGEDGVTRSANFELHSPDKQGGQTAGQSGVTPSVFDEIHSWDIQGD